jgi:hypothetical protein
VSEHHRPFKVPGARDRVEVIDPVSAQHVSSLVESASGETFVLRLAHAFPLPGEAPVRWFDGATAWQAVAKLEQIDHDRVRCQVVPPHAWAPMPARSSPRTPIGEPHLLVRIVSSSVLPGGRRAHTVCLDVSGTGCRATWAGRAPQVGDAVDLTWDVDGQSRASAELGWVAARVARIISRPSGAQEVCFRFQITRSTQAARVRAWHQSWLARPTQRPNRATAA